MKPKIEGFGGQHCDWFAWESSSQHRAALSVFFSNKHDDFDGIWVNYSISLTWMKGIKGDDSPNIHHHLWVFGRGVRSWSNLPRLYLLKMHTSLQHSRPICSNNTGPPTRSDTTHTVVSNLNLNPTIKGFEFEVYYSTVEPNPIIKGYIETHSDSSHVNSQLRVGEDLVAPVAPPPLCASASA